MQLNFKAIPGIVAALMAHQLFGNAHIFAAEALTLRGVHNALGGTMTPAFVAQDLGLFAKHGLQHSLQYIAATTAVQALAAGSEEIGLEGADTVYIAGAAPRPV